MLRPLRLLPIAALSACQLEPTTSSSHGERLSPISFETRDASSIPSVWRPGARADIATGTDDAQTTDATDTAPRSNPPTIAGCEIFPADNPWNQEITSLPVHADSAAYLAVMNASEHLQADWGDWSNSHIGFPINVGQGSPPVPMTWTAPWGPFESDTAPCPDGSSTFCYPIPDTARIEGGPGNRTAADRHLLYLDTSGAPGHCILYELYNTQNWVGPGWTAANGAIFRLDTNALRPDGWTSADEAGLPVLPGLVRVDEVLAGEIRHALRFTMSDTGTGYISPATHGAGPGPSNLPPMGLRLRLRADFDASSFDAPSQVVVRAMQRYGIILADTGPDWFVSGESDDRWIPLFYGMVEALEQVHGSDFEVVYTGPEHTMQ